MTTAEPSADRLKTPGLLDGNPLLHPRTVMPTAAPSEKKQYSYEAVYFLTAP